MNKARRANLQRIVSNLNEVVNLIDACDDDETIGIEDFDRNVDPSKELLQTCIDEEQEYLDNMPEAIAESDTGDIVRNTIEDLESAQSHLEGIDFVNDDKSTMREALSDAVDLIEDVINK